MLYKLKISLLVFAILLMCTILIYSGGPTSYLNFIHERYKNYTNIIPSDLQKIKGIHVYPYRQQVFSSRWSTAHLEDYYYKMIEQKHVRCTHYRVLGDRNEGWGVCVGGPYKLQSDCITYSFGSTVESWEFENRLFSVYNCTVRVMDPIPTHTEKNGIHHYRIGLSYDIKLRNKGLPPLSLILKRFREDNKIIDVLKIVVDFAEWEVLEGLVNKDKEYLKNVKQLMIKTHMSVMKLKATKRSDLFNFIKMHQKLEEFGFRRWITQKYSRGLQLQSPNSNRSRNCCYQYSYINIHFLRSGIKTRNYVFKPLPYKPVLVYTDGIWTAQEAEEHYHKMMETNHGECPFVRRIGREGDGGWDVCFTDDIKPVKPCLVYSFGVNYIWEFDDQMSGELGCEVLAFDPSMMLAMTHRRRSTLMFYKEGLAGTDGFNKQGYKLNKLSSLLKRFQHENRTIDILKMDIEHWEWSSLRAALNDGSLRNVRQFMFETHTSGPRTSAATHVHFMRIWQGLYKLGFRQWQYHNNPYGAYRSEFTGDVRACCHEHYLVNINMLRRRVL